MIALTSEDSVALHKAGFRPVEIKGRTDATIFTCEGKRGRIEFAHGFESRAWRVRVGTLDMRVKSLSRALEVFGRHS